MLQILYLCCEELMKYKNKNKMKLYIGIGKSINLLILLQIRRKKTFAEPFTSQPSLITFFLNLYKVYLISIWDTTEIWRE